MLRESPDENVIAIVTLGNEIRLWSVDGRLLKIIKNNSKITNFEFTPDSQSLVYSVDGNPNSMMVSVR
jgi:WD40 repeat protein